MNNLFQKRVPGWITYPLLIVFSLVIFLSGSFFYVKHGIAQGSILTPFGGTLRNVDYTTCVCGFAILTVYDNQTKQEIQVIYFWAAQLLEKIADVIGVEIADWLRLFIPRIYAYGAIWPGAGEVNVLGNYFPYQGAMCLTNFSEYCLEPVNTEARGYLINMGTSLFPSEK